MGKRIDSREMETPTNAEYVTYFKRRIYIFFNLQN
jgi:hypothetical protein